MTFLRLFPIWIIIALILSITNCCFSQIKITGKVLDIKNQQPLAFVNIGIKEKNIGTYFVLYAIKRHLTEASIFNNFIAASPSIYYHDQYLIKEIDNSPTDDGNIKNTKLYLTIGELEALENQSNTFKDLIKVLTDKAINVQAEVYKNSEHMGTALPTFENGIQLFLK